MHTRYKGPLLIAMTAALWSTAGVLIKQVPWDAMTIVGLRSLIAAVVMAIYMRRPRITFSKPVVLGGLSLSATMVLFIFANKLTTAANAIVLQYTSPIFVILLSALLLRQRPKALDVAAVVVVFGGVMLFFFDQLKADAMLGNILAFISGLTFAGVFIINRMPGAKPEEAMLLGYLINIVVCAPFIVTNVTFELVPWVVIVIMGVFQLGLAYVLFCIGIKHTPPLTASLIAVLEPLLSPIWVMIGTGEKPGVFALIGGAIVLAGMVAYNILSTRRGRLETAALQAADTADTQEAASDVRTI
jgi:drug/metabolite transporter (DMT)-like permease